MTNPKLDLLTPNNSQLIFIDHQPQMAFGVQSIDRQMLKNNVVALAKAAKVFGIPTTITTVETESFSGHTYPELLAVFPEHPLLERTSMNSWDDQKVRDALAANGRKKIIVSGLWTEVCNNTFAFSAMAEGGYEIYMVADASGGTSKDAHDYAMQRMIQAGVVPVTWQQVMLEWQRDWARRETYDAVMAIVQEHSGAYGMGVDYAYTMVHKARRRRVEHGPRLAARRRRPHRTRRRARALCTGSRDCLRTASDRESPCGRSWSGGHHLSGRIAMKVYLIALAAGLLVGAIYALLGVRSPAPPVVALVGLLGILLGEQLPPLARRMIAGEALTAACVRQSCGEHVFGALPSAPTAASPSINVASRRISS